MAEEYNLTDPQSNVEKYLATMTQDWEGSLPDPSSVVEAYLQKIIDEGVGGGVKIEILGTGDFDPSTGVPTISDPEENVFYLVPTADSGYDLYTEWIYKNNSWEKFGSASKVQSDWNESDSTSPAFIRNKPSSATGVSF